MKKTLIALMALAGVAMADSITLTSNMGGSNNASLYDDIVNGTTAWGQETTQTGTLTKTEAVTFYVDVESLFGAGDLRDDVVYSLDSFTYVTSAGEIDGKNAWSYTGGARTWTLSNGTDSVSFKQDTATDKFCTTNFAAQEGTLLTFTKGDMITLTLTPGADEKVVVQYFDTNSPGISFNLVDGEVNNGLNHNTNLGSTSWLYNAPCVKLVVSDVPTPSIPEPATATLSLLALAGLAARRRRH